MTKSHSLYHATVTRTLRLRVGRVAPVARRLADIALAPKDEVALVGGHEAEVQGEIVLHNLTYRYAPSVPEVLRGVTLRIAPGEFVALL